MVQTLVMQRPRASALGWAIGLGGTAVVVVAMFAAADLPITIPALLLLLPIAGASTVATWRTGVVVAVLAAAAYAFAFLPPVGAVRIGLTEDVYVLIAFVLVAVVVGLLTGRSRHRDDSALDEDRALLLRSVSHDLRSPLTTITSVSSDLAGRDDYDDRTRHELMALVASEADRLNRIVGHLLSASRAASGSLDPDLQPVRIDRTVDDVLARVDDDRVVARLGGTGEREVLADPVLIDQVLTNLVDNAVRHAAGATSIAIAASEEQSTIRIDVIDDGVGAETTSAGVASGGVGLSLCRSVVEVHGGTLTLSSDERGTRASFTLQRCS